MKLLAKWPLKTVSLKQKAPIKEPKPKNRPQKNLMPVLPLLLEPAPTKITGDVIEVDKSQSKGHKMVMSIIESKSKIHKPKSYDKADNNPIHRQRWQETIKEILQNLENH